MARLTAATARPPNGCAVNTGRSGFPRAVTATAPSSPPAGGQLGLGLERQILGLYGLGMSYEDIRSLEPLYPRRLAGWRIREQGRVVVRTVYFIIGVDLEGHKDVLGFYIGEHESAKCWLSVLTSLQQRGMKDILIACTDNLAGFAEAIESVFLSAGVQLCINHQVRNSMKFIPYKDYRPFAAGLKKIVTVYHPCQ